MIYWAYFIYSGLDNAGKSTVLDKWIRLTCACEIDSISSNPSKICPTFGFEIKTISTQSLKLNFWDIGGQKSIRPFWRNYYEETDAIVWVIDSTDSGRLEICKSELESVLNADVSERWKFIPDKIKLILF